MKIIYFCMGKMGQDALTIFADSNGDVTFHVQDGLGNEMAVKTYASLTPAIVQALGWSLERDPLQNRRLREAERTGVENASGMACKAE